MAGNLAANSSTMDDLEGKEMGDKTGFVRPGHNCGLQMMWTTILTTQKVLPDRMTKWRCDVKCKMEFHG